MSLTDILSAFRKEPVSQKPKADWRKIGLDDVHGNSTQIATRAYLISAPGSYAIADVEQYLSKK